MILILGGPRFSTIEVEIYRQAAQLLDLRTCVRPGAAPARVARRAALRLRALPGAHRGQDSAGSFPRCRHACRARPRRRRSSIGNLAVMAVLLGLPLALLVERSLSTGSGYGLDYYFALFDESARSSLVVPPIEAIGNSLLYAAIATAIAATSGLMAAQVIAERTWPTAATVRRAADAAARDLGGDPGLRLPRSRWARCPSTSASHPGSCRSPTP